MTFGPPHDDTPMPWRDAFAKALWQDPDYQGLSGNPGAIQSNGCLDT